MRHGTEHETEAGGQPAIEWQHSMRGDSAEQRACPFLVKDAPRQTLGRPQSTKTERGKGEGVTRPSHRTKCGSFKARPVVHDTAKQPCV
jgi:hypothetical protein